MTFVEDAQRVVTRAREDSGEALAIEFLVDSPRECVEPIWRELEERHGAGGLTSSWVWTETWLRHYGDLVPHFFVVATAAGEPAGCALLTHGVGSRRGPFHLRTLHLGTAGEPDGETVRVEYNRLLVAPAERTTFVAALLAALQSSQLRYDVLALDGFPPDEVEPLLQVEPRFVVQRHLCPVADLRGIRERGGAVSGALRKETSYAVKRSIRRLESVHGGVSLEWADSLDLGNAILAELIDLHQTRWRAAGQPGSFASARFTGFHRDLVQRLLPAGQIMLARVRAGDATVGCHYGLIERNRILFYQSGVHLSELPGVSAGLVTGALVMQAALDRGFDEYDWLAGDARYKRQLSTTSRELVWARAPHGRWMAALDALTAAYHRSLTARDAVCRRWPHRRVAAGGAP